MREIRPATNTIDYVAIDGAGLTSASTRMVIIEPAITDTAERDVATAFEFAQKLVQVGDVQGLARLQTDFIQAQMQAITEQATDLRETAAKAVMDSLKTPTPNAAQATVTLKHFAAVLAERHEMTKKQSEEILNHAVGLVTNYLKKGERIRIAGLGILQVRERAARMGRNPATGEQLNDPRL